MSENPLAPISELSLAPFTSPSGDYILRCRPAGHVIAALGLSDAKAAPFLAAAEPFAVRPAGPQEWLLVGAAAWSIAELRTREQELGGAVALIDVSHGRERLEIAGPGAARKLTTGTAVNLSLAAFPEGSSCETLLGPIAVHLTRTGTQVFEILVSRSLAASLWRALT